MEVAREFVEGRGGGVDFEAGEPAFDAGAEADEHAAVGDNLFNDSGQEFAGLGRVRFLRIGWEVRTIA